MLNKIVIFLAAQLTICSLSPLCARNTYNGIEISAETIASFIEPLPNEAIHIKKWIKKHAAMLRFLAACPAPLSSWEEKKLRGNTYLEEHGYENLGSNNFVFYIPDSDWLIKISGPLRRVTNIYMYNTNTDPYIPTEYKRHKAFGNKKLLNRFKVVPTYVTISRFANALLCKDVCKKNNIENIYFPDIYLVHIPGNPHDISDDNYIILEKQVPNIENICSHKQERRALTRKALRELYLIITQAGIFDFNGENLQIDNHNNLIFIDLEQGMVENPSHFFNKDKQMFDFRVYEGLTSFVETHLEPFRDKYDFFSSLLAKDDSLRTSSEWQDIKRYFSLTNEQSTSNIKKSDVVANYKDQT
ncbi:MAG: hypothetical protein AB7F19_03170 [Candidatus Babeliales bacterium]